MRSTVVHYAKYCSSLCQSTGLTLPRYGLGHVKARPLSGKCRACACISRKVSYLCDALVCHLPLASGGAIKRESGANPGQSRCCEFHETLQAHLSTTCHWRARPPGRRLPRKQVRRPAMQICLTAFEEKAMKSQGCTTAVGRGPSFINPLFKESKE